jgi:uncharacterized membrane protein
MKFRSFIVKRQGLLKKHPVIIFFLLTYIFSWLIWMPMVLTNQESRLLLIVGTFGPTLVALLLTGLSKGPKWPAGTSHAVFLSGELVFFGTCSAF